MWPGLKKLFGMAQEPPEPRCRVFHVTDPDLRSDLLAIVDENTRFLNNMLTAAFTNDGETLKKGLEEAVRKDPQGQLDDLLNWPFRERMIQTGTGSWLGFTGPEIILSKGEVYVTTPSADYYRNHNVYGDNNDKVVAGIDLWQVPEGLQETVSLRFGARPVGVPTVSPPDRELKRLNLVTHIPKPW